MRLIDGNYLYDELKSNGIENMYLGSEVLKMVKEEPTIEAIPKADYENRLKADMLAMLGELKKEIEEIPNSYEYKPIGTYDYSLGAEHERKVNLEIIQQKINKLKGEEDGNK